MEDWDPGIKAELNAYSWNVGDQESFVRKSFDSCTETSGQMWKQRMK